MKRRFFQFSLRGLLGFASAIRPMPRRFQFRLWVLFYLMAWTALGAVVYRTVEREYRASQSGFDSPEYQP